jgi:hypothetical protein
MTRSWDDPVKTGTTQQTRDNLPKLGQDREPANYVLRMLAAARLRVYFIEIWARGGSTTTAGEERSNRKRGARARGAEGRRGATAGTKSFSYNAV